jgi:acyl-CoA reductase-like NAD-dependent aldehyde dehydrogenase
MALKGAIASKYRNAGQGCVCTNRILVQDSVYDAFIERLSETAGGSAFAQNWSVYRRSPASGTLCAKRVLSDTGRRRRADRRRES